MAKNAIILLAEGFEEIEAVVCIDLLRRAGIEVTVGGLKNLTVKGSRRIEIKADKIIKGDSSYDACILPGGMPGAENIASSDTAVQLIKKMAEKEKIIGAICASPAIVLAPLGLIDNKKATCYPGMESHFPDSAIYINNKVVIDKNIITSQGPATAFEFALKIIEKLSGKEISGKIRKAVLQ